MKEIYQKSPFQTSIDEYADQMIRYKKQTAQNYIMDRNTVYTVQALLVLLPEPCSCDKPTVILTRKVTLPITAEMLLSMSRSNEFVFQGRSFKVDTLEVLNLLSLTCTASAYLTFEEQRNPEIMTGLIYSSWVLAVSPDEARILKIAIPEELLARFETSQTQPA